MKNAMKKLTSLLLVAVLLVGAIPFGAFAAEFNPTAFLGTNSEAAATAAEPAPASLDASNEPAADAPAAQSSTGTQKTISYVVDYPDQNDLSGTIPVKTGDSWTTVLKYITTVSEKYTVTPSFSTVEDSTESVTFTCTVKTFNFTVKINNFNESTKQGVAYGTVLKLDESLLSEFGLSLATGYEIDTFSVSGDTYTVTNTDTIIVYPKLAGTAGSNSGNNSGSSSTNTNTSVWADVVINTAKKKGDRLESSDYLRLYTVDGKITETQRQQVASAIAGKNVVAWELEDGRTSNSLINFTFTGPTNVWPKVGSTTSTPDTNNSTSNTTGTVIFKNHAGATMYTANLTNGKLNATDVNNAHNAANRSGYTFGGWKINGTGTAAASDLLLNMTFNNGDYLAPTYTEIPVSSTINSAKNQNDIFLNIFVNKDFQNCKTIKLNDHWVISDDKITKDEILQYVVTDYYKASNGNLGLQADKLYYSIGSFMYNWLTDNGTMTIDNISAKRAQGTVTVNIMVTNAAVKGNTAAADASNPKTGDDIYTAMTVMGLSAASLAAVMFFYNKKRYTV